MARDTGPGGHQHGRRGGVDAICTTSLRESGNTNVATPIRGQPAHITVPTTDPGFALTNSLRGTGDRTSIGIAAVGVPQMRRPNPRTRGDMDGITIRGLPVLRRELTDEERLAKVFIS
jgi:hypothetical protein